MDRFKNTYRIPSTRVQNWDYGWKGAYFITICTANRECFFGEIRDGKMLLNELGKVVEDEWIKAPDIRPDLNLSLGVHIVMPNHVHGVIHICRNEFNQGEMGGECRDAIHRVSTGIASLQFFKNILNRHLFRNPVF